MQCDNVDLVHLWYLSADVQLRFVAYFVGWFLFFKRPYFISNLRKYYGRKLFALFLLTFVVTVLNSYPAIFSDTYRYKLGKQSVENTAANNISYTEQMSIADDNYRRENRIDNEYMTWPNQRLPGLLMGAIFGFVLKNGNTMPKAFNSCFYNKMRKIVVFVIAICLLFMAYFWNFNWHLYGLQKNSDEKPACNMLQKNEGVKKDDFVTITEKELYLCTTFRKLIALAGSFLILLLYSKMLQKRATKDQLISQKLIMSKKSYSMLTVVQNIVAFLSKISFANYLTHLLAVMVLRNNIQYLLTPLGFDYVSMLIDDRVYLSYATIVVWYMLCYATYLKKSDDS